VSKDTDDDDDDEDAAPNSKKGVLVRSNFLEEVARFHPLKPSH
jgi:hypothetical protein